MPRCNVYSRASHGIYYAMRSLGARPSGCPSRRSIPGSFDGPSTTLTVSVIGSVWSHLSGVVAGHEGKRSGLFLHTTLIDRILVSSEVVAPGRMLCGRVSSLVDPVLFDRQTEVFGKAPEPFGDEGDGDEEQGWKLVQLVIRNIPCNESSNPMAHCRQPLTRDG